jgi:diguanylate cyclase
MAKDDAETWKKKYYTGLEKLEKQDNQLKALDELLRDGFARLSLAAEGHDPDVDRELKKLRKLARGKHEMDELRAALTKVAKLVRQPETAATPAERAAEPAASTAWQAIDELISELHLPPAEKSALARTRSEKAAGRMEQQWQALLHELSLLINRHLDSQALAGDADGAPTTATNSILLELLHCIPLPPELVDRLEGIRSRLQHTVQDNEWPKLLNDIADLIAEMRRRVESEKNDLERFLVQLTQRLREIDTSLQGATTDRRTSYESGQALDQSVREQVGKIETSMQQSQSLDQLKSAIHGHIDAIRVRMETHRHEEDRRQRTMEQRLEEMGSKLRQFERETGELRNTLQVRRDQARMDALTGVPNRLGWDEQLSQQLQRWQRYQTPLALLVLDVDHFKNINDEYGHKAGDKALQLIARQLRQSLRDTDFMARYGGEEFTVLITDASVSRVADVAEKLRQSVAATEFHFHGQRVAISLSCGYAVIRKEDSGDSLFQRADAALYRAKALGRNRSCNGDENGAT